MNVFVTIRQRLGWKLGVSYLIVIAVAVLVMASAAQFHTTEALNHHMATMQALADNDPVMQAALEESFHAAVNEILVVAAVAAILAAVTVSLFTTRRIVGPIRQMLGASQHIAAGHYNQRVEVAGEDELSELARSFNQMAATLDNTEQRRLALIGDLAHELRTPLANIRATMEGLTDGVLAPQPDTFHDIEREAVRLQRLVSDLEELSRAEAGQIALSRQDVDPGDLIRSVAGRLRPQFDDKDVALTLDLPAKLPPVHVDPARITQVLLNLLGNALQYTPPGGVVTVSARDDTRQLLVAVQDSGVGISAADLPHVFERFYRVDKSRSRAGGGSGVGLTISQHIVEAHGGRITADSPGAGMGSMVTFTLPHTS
ncbi:MAG: HAMP domain-containing protein [Anaerolineae bacterium]|nr:HAMP domain-containing protein [Anaerolineae bacterium]